MGVRFPAFLLEPSRSADRRIRTLEGWLEVGGKVLGGGTYKVSEDGKTLAATMEGMGLKGPFKTIAVFQRVEPDPYTPRP